MYENGYLNYQYEEEKSIIISKRTLNLIVVPGGAAVKLDDPNKEPDVPPKGLDAVLVVPNNPPLLVLVPKAAKQFKQLHRSILLIQDTTSTINQTIYSYIGMLQETYC